MNNSLYFLAVDLGATSGRTIIGNLHDGGVELQELTRFGNTLIHANGHYYWDILALYHEIVQALRLAGSRHLPLASIGIDTWGCDFALLGADGMLLGYPLAYRDPHTAHTMEHYFREQYSRETVYRKTGIEQMPFNTLFQLYQMRADHSDALAAARRVLFTPDALIYLLTGQTVCEYTIASTGSLMNPVSRSFDTELLRSVGLSPSSFGRLVAPGTVVGQLSADVQAMTGLGPVPVVAVAGHDTASAVAAVPAVEAVDAHFAYLSSGTWSLMGIETPHPIINDDSFRLNFTNEGGIEGATCFLKNICGMWIYERCRQEWRSLKDVSHADLQRAASEQPPFRSIINPDDALFANPTSMTAAIDTFCRRTSQPVPDTPAAYCRCAFDSLALRYRQVFRSLCQLAPFPISELHIIGGGSLNEFLDQSTADACGVTVLAGPQEATALGNILLQAKACGAVADVHQMRQIVASSVSLKTFRPNGGAQWDTASRLADRLFSS